MSTGDPFVDVTREADAARRAAERATRDRIENPRALLDGYRRLDYVPAPVPGLVGRMNEGVTLSTPADRRSVLDGTINNYAALGGETYTLITTGPAGVQLVAGERVAVSPNGASILGFPPVDLGWSDVPAIDAVVEQAGEEAERAAYETEDPVADWIFGEDYDFGDVVDDVGSAARSGAQAAGTVVLQAFGLTADLIAAILGPTAGALAAKTLPWLAVGAGLYWISRRAR